MQTYVDEIEAAEDEVARWAAKMVEDVTAALMPDGRGYQKEVLPEDLQLQLYVEQFRGNPEAWHAWIQNAIKTIVDYLKEAGLSDADVASVHPPNIAQLQAMRYSLRMERRLLAKSPAADYDGSDLILPMEEEPSGQPVGI